jgi:cob(I)alamin adenosyltransferase
MGHRLSRIVTRTGDDGTTGLADGRRVAKQDARIAALGTVDELNSQLGVLRAEPLPDDIQALLAALQNDLFDLGGELAMPDYTQVNDGHILRLDTAVAELNADLPPLKEFILPGGTRGAALAHVCRTVCRRAERDLCVLHAETPIAANLLRYLNRLSDLLFILARHLIRQAGVAEPAWRGPAPPA